MNDFYNLILLVSLNVVCTIVLVLEGYGIINKMQDTLFELRILSNNLTAIKHKIDAITMSLLDDTQFKYTTKTYKEPKEL